MKLGPRALKGNLVDYVKNPKNMEYWIWVLM